MMMLAAAWVIAVLGTITASLTGAGCVDQEQLPVVRESGS